MTVKRRVYRGLLQGYDESTTPIFIMPHQCENVKEKLTWFGVEEWVEDGEQWKSGVCDRERDSSSLIEVCRCH